MIRWVMLGMAVAAIGWWYYPSKPVIIGGATAICNDGAYSMSETRRGTCSHHGGVRERLVE